MDSSSPSDASSGRSVALRFVDTGVIRAYPMDERTDDDAERPALAIPDNGLHSAVKAAVVLSASASLRMSHDADAPWNKYGGTAGDVYERYMVPRVFAPWAELHLRAAGLQAGERVLDVACGTGIVARRAAESVGSGGIVVGLDVNPVMLATARANDPGGAVDWREGDAQALPFADGDFDVVSCQYGVMFFRDKAAGLREMLRVLRPGGRAVVSVGGRLDDAPGYAALSAGLARHVSPEAGYLPPFALGDPEVLRRLMAEAGFAAVDVQSDAIILRFPSAEEFVGIIAAGAPTMLGALGTLSGASRRAVPSAWKATAGPMP